MSAKTKTKQDQSLIKKLFAFDPIDWARYPDGVLAFISPSGQKYAYTDEELQEIDHDLKEKQKLQKPATKAPATTSASAKPAVSKPAVSKKAAPKK